PGSSRRGAYRGLPYAVPGSRAPGRASPLRPSRRRAAYKSATRIGPSGSPRSKGNVEPARDGQNSPWLYLTIAAHAFDWMRSLIDGGAYPDAGGRGQMNAPA